MLVRAWRRASSQKLARTPLLSAWTTLRSRLRRMVPVGMKNSNQEERDLINNIKQTITNII